MEENPAENEVNDVEVSVDTNSADGTSTDEEIIVEDEAENKEDE